MNLLCLTIWKCSADIVVRSVKRPWLTSFSQRECAWLNATIAINQISTGRIASSSFVTAKVTNAAKCASMQNLNYLSANIWNPVLIPMRHCLFQNAGHMADSAPVASRMSFARFRFGLVCMCTRTNCVIRSQPPVSVEACRLKCFRPLWGTLSLAPQ